MVDAEEGATVANDDFITLDFKGEVDGVAFAGGEGKDYPLQIGSILLSILLKINSLVLKLAKKKTLT